MYLSGDVPLILQGGGAYNTPQAAMPQVPAYVWYGALGLLGAFLLATGKSGGRKVW